MSKEVRDAKAHLLIVLAGKSIPEYELQKEIFAEKGILFIDATTKALTPRISGKGQKVYYRYSGHWTPAAHKAVADILTSTIEQNELCSSLS